MKLIGEERINRTAVTTDRESAIIFGISPKVIEGILVGKNLEEDNDFLDYIKKRLPNCYICNLYGNVIK